MPRKPERIKTLLAALLGLLAALVLLEGLCQAYYFLIYKAAYDPDRVLGVLGAAPRTKTTKANATQLPDLLVDQREVVHPYTGYVRDFNDAFRAHFGYDTDFAPIQERSPDKCLIALFGGSVAMHLHHDLYAAFKAAFAKAGLKKEPVLINFALGGYKQPQQLAALNYFLALGAQFDVVINLDGFNELALSVTDNLEKGVFPYYPRDWAQRLPQTLDPERLRAVAELEALRRGLEGVAEGLRSPVLGRSAAFGLWSQWRAARLKRAMAVRAAGLEHTGPLPYVQSGPAFENTSPVETLVRLAEFWERCSRLMAAACQASGSAYFHFLQPNQYVEGQKRLTEEERVTAYAPDQPYSRAARLGYPALIALGQKLAASGIAFFDATPLYKDETGTIYADACCHVNEAGNRLLAAFVTEKVMPAIAGR